MNEMSDFAELQQNFFTALISDCLDAVGRTRQAMPSLIRPLDESRILVGRARTAASLTSIPQPGLFPRTSAPSSITGGSRKNSSRQRTLSISISMMRKFGTTAEKCALIIVQRWP